MCIEPLERRMLLAAFHVAALGDDATGDGSKARPFATLERASHVDLEPGDTLRLRAGDTFVGTLELTHEHSGISGKPVRVTGWGRGRPVIAPPVGAGVMLRDVEHTELRSLTIIGTGSGLASGIDIINSLPGGTRLHHLKIDRVEVSRFGDAGLSIRTDSPDGSKSGFADVRISSVDAHHNGDAGIRVSGAFSATSDAYAHADVRITRSIAHHNGGIAGKGSNSGSGIVMGDVDGGIIERSVAHHNGASNDYPFGGPVGIWAWDSRRIVIQRNVSYANSSATLDGGGFDLDGGTVDCILQNNRSYDNKGSGYMLAQFESARPMRRNVVRRNISINDGAGIGPSILIWNGGSGITESSIYRNTVVTVVADPIRIISEGVDVEIFSNKIISV